MKAYFSVFSFFFTLASAENMIKCGTPSAGPVLNGLDLVETLKSLAYGNAPVFANSTEHSYVDEDGFVFQFASEENKETYLANVDLYQIGAGGYCGFAVSGFDPACGSDGDSCNGPACLTSDETAEILVNDGKMYFFLGNGALNQFMKTDGSRENAADNLEEARKSSGYANCYNTDLFRCKGE